MKTHVKICTKKNKHMMWCQRLLHVTLQLRLTYLIVVVLVRSLRRKTKRHQFTIFHTINIFPHSNIFSHTLTYFLTLLHIFSHAALYYPTLINIYFRSLRRKTKHPATLLQQVPTKLGPECDQGIYFYK